MLSQELKDLLIQVITSWQVLTVTVVVILYIFLVNYVARVYRRNPIPMPGSGKPKKAAAAPETVPEPGDELGLEEKKEE